ncbi:MAG: diguanylate cyclase, partial [Desulfosarcina sp.]|nr:diguanylate cyclase [Desulfosarcina sp.]
MTQKLLIITESPTVRGVFDSVAEKCKSIRITWLDAASLLKRLLDDDANASSDDAPIVIVADLDLSVFNRSDLKNHFLAWSRGAAALAILPDSMMQGDNDFSGLDDLKFFDILRRPLYPVDLRFRLKAALSFVESKKVVKELRLSAKVFENSGEAIMITDREDRILKVNPAFTDATGYPMTELVGKRPDFLNSGRQNGQFYENMWAGVRNHGHWKGEVWNRRKNGEIFPQWMAVSAVRSIDGRIDHYVTILSDITDRLAEEKHLRHLAQHDFLTGLPNRVLLKDRFNQASASIRRHGGKMAVMFIDLDKFKAINDRHGHTIGDRLLVMVAERLLSSLRSMDTVSRWGGDEFVLLFSEVKSLQQAAHLAEKVVHGLQEPFRVGELELIVSASAGISLYPDHGT